MRLELTGRHVTITPALRRLVDAKIARLDRMLQDTAVSAQVVVSREKRNHRADITLHARGEKFLHGVGTASAWEPAMTAAIDKIVQQAQRVKGKWQERKRRAIKGAAAEGAEAGPDSAAAPPARPAPVRARMPRILRTSRQAIRTMTLSDAARQMDRNGDGVLVFRDVETTTLCVICRGAKGDLTLVETES